jgi:hypothetical protein
MVFLSTSRKICENIGAEHLNLKWEINRLLDILGNAKIIPFGSAQKIYILRPTHSGRLREDREAENKFQEELLNPALLWHKFLVA